jgi:hypothetical protein
LYCIDESAKPIIADFSGYIRHLFEVHDIELDGVEGSFASTVEFKQFIDSLYTSHRIQFAQPNGKTTTEESISYTLYCSRSVNTKRDQLDRERKSNRAPIRSAKLETMCTAYLQIAL